MLRTWECPLFAQEHVRSLTNRLPRMHYNLLYPWVLILRQIIPDIMTTIRFV